MISNVQHAVTVAFPTLGCKVNRYDSDALARDLIARGYVIVPANQPADIYIVNTCTVTGEADAKSRKMLRRALRINDDATLIITGCYATLEPEKLRAIPGVDAVVPIEEQPGIPDLLMRLRPPAAGATGQGLSASVERTRATVKVQDGCNLKCAFCAVTLARGGLRSRPILSVVEELRTLVQGGVQEIVLTGIRLDAYGLDLPAGQRLADLLDATQSLAIPRLRLSSLEPIGITQTLVERMAAHPGLCRHFHVCLQSGDDGILRAMRRGYTAGRYRRIIAMLREAMPDATFTTDIIVGFPGESDDAFANTCAIAEEIGFIKMHIFKYSPRPHTLAATLPQQVPEDVKDARSQALFALERQIFATYAAKMVGKYVPVLVEQTGPDGDGLTPGYVRVCSPYSEGMAGTEQQVLVTGIGPDFVLGSCK